MTPNKLKQILKDAVEHGEQLLIVGPPGIGKTDIVKAVCQELGADVILSHPAVSDPTDYKGPREWDNLGTMVCFHGRYCLGDKGHGFRQDDFNSWEELKAGILKENGPCIIHPLYLYDHSGITISTSPFSCRWDSGQVGFIFVSHATLRKEYSVKRVSKRILALAENCLQREVKTFDNYITGNVYGFKVLDNEEKEIDSCWGFYGDYEDKEHGALGEARRVAENAADTFRNLIREKLREVEEKKKQDLADKLDAALEHQREINQSQEETEKSVQAVQ